MINKTTTPRHGLHQVAIQHAGKLALTLALGGLGLLASAQVASASYLSTTNVVGSGSDWSSAIWQTNSTPGLPNGQSGTARGADGTYGPGNDFDIITNGVIIQTGVAANVPFVRTPNLVNASVTTFLGKSLTVNTNTRLGAKTLLTSAIYASSQWTGMNITNLILRGGLIKVSGANSTAVFWGGMNVLSQSYFSDGKDNNQFNTTDTANAGSFQISSALSGPGNLYFIALNAGRPCYIDGGTNNSNYTGKIIVQDAFLIGTNAGSLGTNSLIVDPYDTSYLADYPNVSTTIEGAGSATLDIAYDISSAGTLFVNTNGKVVLHSSCAFRAVTINGTVLTNGYYSYSTLTNMFSSSFASGSSPAGSITVQPYQSNWPTNFPIIDVQPQPVATTVGQSVALSVTQRYGKSFQWYQTSNGVVTALTDGSGRVGSSTTTLSFTNVALTNTGSYFVVITNSTGSVTSSVVSLAVFNLSATPVISNVYPNGTNIYQPASSLTFTVNSSVASLASSGIQVTLNSVNASNHTTFSGNFQTLNVSCLLLPNQYYVAVISVTDTNGLQASQNIRFDTFIPNGMVTIEAEDYDYNGGQWIPNAGIDAYAGLPGTDGIDMHVTIADGTADTYIYRGTNQMACYAQTTDVPRLAYGTNTDYGVGYYHVGEWMNYTRNVPAGTYNIYARASSGNVGSQGKLWLVTGGVGTSSQTTSYIGKYHFDGRGWNSYDFYELYDDSTGSVIPITVTLSGTNTFKLTTDWEHNVDFIILVPVINNAPMISNLFPSGKSFFQVTNKLSFTVSDIFDISQSSMKLFLDGVDVSSQMSLSGNSKAWNVSVPVAQNSAYNAVFTATDSYGTTITNVFSFDTFSPTNFTFEAEDWDFNDGQYIDNPAIDAYQGMYSYSDDVDYHVEGNPGGPWLYRPTSQSTSVTSDALRQSYSSIGATDYQISNWSSNSWCNYTHTYPAGVYNIWARYASSTNFNVMLTNTVGGVSTYLGKFTGAGSAGAPFGWASLKNTSGQPASVALGGVSTLKMVTDGNVAGANFYVLVPTNSVVQPPVQLPTNVLMTASMSSGGAGGSQFVFTFPTTNGFNYQVLYKTNLTDPTWLLLNTLTGNNAAQSVTNAMGDKSRFFRLQIQ